jgi:hypothetical protein
MLLATRVMGAAALLAICSSTSTAHAAASTTRPLLAGTWSGTYSGAYSGTFTIHWRKSGSRLSGTIILSNPSGKYAISGSVHGKVIAFGAVGAGATYTGSVSGKSMSGNYKSPGGGGSWSARKTS